MPSVWSLVNGMLVHNRTGVVPDVQYVNPAILDLVQNYPVFVVVNHFTIHVYRNPVLARDYTVLIDPMFVRAVLSVKAVVVKELMFTWEIYPCALCVLN